MNALDLARHYTRFRVTERALLTGHSHQAWPDAAFEAQQQAWLDAAECVDDKWDRAFAVADRVRAGYRRLLDDPGGHIALSQNTLELVARFLSALPLRTRPRLVTTNGEFHTIRRLLGRLEEEGIEVVRVPAKQSASLGAGDLASELADAVNDETAAVLASSVLFRDATIVDGLGEVAAACTRFGAEMLVDAYHSLCAVPFSIAQEGLDNAFVVGGGYKYCQLGEGNGFLRIPPNCELRPIFTGWFAEFSERGAPPASARRANTADVAIPNYSSSTHGNPRPSPVKLASPDPADSSDHSKTPYPDGHLRFAGATYDPVSHYRAAAVFDFFREQELTPPRLRVAGLSQIRRLAARIDALDLDPAVLSRDRTVPLERKGGFLALQAPRAGELACALRARGVYADHRGKVLRLGPAPYVTDAQLDEATAALAEAVRAAELERATFPLSRSPTT